MTRGLADEFGWIGRLKRLTRGDPAARGLTDDAAVLPVRPGFELVVTTDSMTAGVHFLEDEAPDIVAQRLLRTNLSDLAAKAAEPYGYLLTTSFPPAYGEVEREAFARGLEADSETFGLTLLGGDTTSTQGPLSVGATLFGWTPTGLNLPRHGALAGDSLVVLGAIGDGWLGLRAARGEIEDPTGTLARHYRTPEPLLMLRESLRRHGRATADVSDGLLADASHIAQASGLALDLEAGLHSLPLSLGGAWWLADQADSPAARLKLAVGGDDYAIVCATPRPDALIAEVLAMDVPAARLGVFREGRGLTIGGEAPPEGPTGWRHS